MLVQHRNQVNRECLYAWYPEVATDPVTSTFNEPRDIYIHSGIDKALLARHTHINQPTSTVDIAKTSNDRAYHSTDTIDEALRTPWALDYEVLRHPASPNLPAHITEISQGDVVARRLKSAPLIRSNPSTTILTIPEPCFLLAPIPTAPVVSTETRPRVRASSAKARLNTTIATDKPPVRREIKSATGSRRQDAAKLSDKEIHQIVTQIYGNKTESQPSVQIIYTEPAATLPVASPVYTYTKSSSWTPETIPSKIDPNPIEVTAIPLNPHYVHRPGVIAIRNHDKTSIIRANSGSRRADRHHRRCHYGKRNEPLHAFVPIPVKTKLSLEIDGVKLTYDPKLLLDERSSNVTKHFIDGRLYLVKGQRYNILDNIDPITIDKYNRHMSGDRRAKYSRAVSKDNLSDPFLYKSSTKTAHHYVIYDNLNINKMSLSKRPTSSHVHP